MNTKTTSGEKALRPFPVRHFVRLVCLIAVMLATAPAMRAAEIIERRDLEILFEQHGLAGAFVLLDTNRDLLQVVHPGRMDARRIPASTFKIANSLIALETGVVADEQEIIPYGGRPQPVKSWERDMSMRDAIRVSNVPVYQELARRIGLERYGEWLEKLQYGNRSQGGNVERFWLDGPLAISPLEQVGFLARLARGELDAFAKNQETVRDILLLQTGDFGRLHAKGGWSLAANPQIGWWVGWVERDDAIFAFALTVDIETPADARKREPLGRALLNALDVLK